MKRPLKRRLKNFGLTVVVFFVLLVGYGTLLVIHNVLRHEIIKAHSEPVEWKLPIPPPDEKAPR
jgi:hypothetical protein